MSEVAVGRQPCERQHSEATIDAVICDRDVAMRRDERVELSCVALSLPEAGAGGSPFRPSQRVVAVPRVGLPSSVLHAVFGVFKLLGPSKQMRSSKRLSTQPGELVNQLSIPKKGVKLSVA